MVRALREEFNRTFSQERYEAVKRSLADRSGCSIDFRIAETPLFLPKEFAAKAGKLAEDLLLTAASPAFQQLGVHAIPSDFSIPAETSHPTFAAVDFAICGSIESPELQLIELQGFPSLYYFQALYSQVVRDVYDLPAELTGLVYSSDDYDSYFDLLNKTIIANEDPSHVVLLELDPYQQKTLPDFLLTARDLGIHLCNIRDLVRRENKLFYNHEGRQIEIRRIYNRTIYDELKAKKIELPVDLTTPLDVRWAGHPNWYYRISKILLPELSRRFDAVPRGYLLSDLPFSLSNIDLDRYVLKPLYSFAGSGVVVGPTLQEIANVPSGERDKWMLQERVSYADVIHTPEGYGVKAELRIMLVWPDNSVSPKATHTLVRLTRGKMVGVDFNKGLDWVGSSCALVV